jgi:hypothetical protein
VCSINEKIMTTGVLMDARNLKVCWLLCKYSTEIWRISHVFAGEYA